MATTVTFKLNKPANQFAAGESTGFGIRGGVQYYDRETKQKEWCNYEAVIFAKAPGQIQFYASVLVEGAIIEVTGKQCKIRSFDGNNGQQLSIELLDASLGYAHNPQGQATGAQNQQQAPQPNYQQPQAPQQQPMQNVGQQQSYQQTQQQQPPQQQRQQQQRQPMGDTQQQGGAPIYDDKMPF